MIVFCEFISYETSDTRQAWRDEFLHEAGILVYMESRDDGRYYFIPYEDSIVSYRYIHTGPGELIDEGDGTFTVSTAHTEYHFRLVDLPYRERSEMLLRVRL